MTFLYYIWLPKGKQICINLYVFFYFELSLQYSKYTGLFLIEFSRVAHELTGGGTINCGPGFVPGNGMLPSNIGLSMIGFIGPINFD